MATPKQNAAWARSHPNWKAKTQARFARNHPQPLFPSTNVTSKEMTGLLGGARTQVTKSYAATPMPPLTQYLQPFADAQARNTAAGANYQAYLGQARDASQNISGAFQQALTGGINAGAATVQSQGGSAPDQSGIPPASQALIPTAAIGSSFSQYLNAMTPYVGAKTQEANNQVNAQQASALTDYRDAETKRRAEVQDAIQKLYQSSLDTLIQNKVAANKAAVTEYLALGKTAYQKAQLGVSRTRANNDATYKKGQLALGRDKLNETKGYHQQTLDAKRTSAAAKGVDLKPIYSTLFAGSSAPGKGAPGRVGPDGQRGRWYSVTPLTKLASGGTLSGTPVRQFVRYGDTVPVSDGTRKVTPGDFEYPKTSSSSTNRKATAASWDRAWTQLLAKYRGQYGEKYLRSLMPPRPAK